MLCGFRALVPVLLAAVSVLVAGPAAAENLRLVSGVAALEGRQVQRPVWAPGTQPQLVHEITDRSRLTWLRVLRVDGASTSDEMVPGSRSSRMEALGAAADRADSGAAWWDESSFFFVRSVGGSSSLFYFDGVPREVPGLPGRVDEVRSDTARGRLFATVESNGVDVFRLAGKGFTEEKVQLSQSPSVVENSLAISADEGGIFWISATPTGTRLGGASPAEPSSVRERLTADRLHLYELISLEVLPGAEGMIAYARVPAGVTDPEVESHVIVHLSRPIDGRCQLTELVRDVYVPPGLAPRAAFSDGGRLLYYVAESAEQSNPVMRLDRATGKTSKLALGTRGHQEVAVRDYVHSDGQVVPWIAVVSVGDGAGKDVRNHLYVGPLEAWPGW